MSDRDEPGSPGAARGRANGRGPLSDPRVRGALGTGALFLAVQVLALLVAPRLAGSGVSYGDGGGLALVPLVVGLVLGTLLSLAVVRYGASRRLVRALLFVSLGAALWFACAAFLGSLGGALAAVVGVGLAWYSSRPAVRNAVAVVAVAGAAGLFGASLDPPYALVALVLAALYDVYAVYVSGHMVAMADASAEMRLPSMFVVPTSDAYDDAALRPGGEGAPAATVLGAGDALFPAILTASAAVDLGPWSGFLAAPLGFPLPVWGALVGSLAGLAGLQWFVHRHAGVHAGLPFVNGGAVAGYLIGVALVGA